MRYAKLCKNWTENMWQEVLVQTVVSMYREGQERGTIVRLQSPLKTHWRFCYNPFQLLVLGTLSKLIEL